MRHSIVLLLLVLIGSAVPTLAAPGDLDPTFNTTGVVVTPVLTDAKGTSVVHQLDDKIVVAGSASNGTSYDFVLVRYDTSGALDPSFGGTGIVTTAVGAGDDEVDALIQQADGKLVAAGLSYTEAFDSSTISLVRYLDSGTPDPAFGGGTGKVTTTIGTEYDGALAIIQQADDKLVVAGYSGTDIALVRYETDGTLDMSFNGTGIVTTPVVGTVVFSTAFALLQQAADQKLVIAGSVDADIVLARYGTTGTLDSTFNGTGIVRTPVGTGDAKARALIQQASDGKLVVAGVSSNVSNTDFTLVRYGLDGTPDAMFGTLGIVATPIGSGDDQAFGLAQQEDGKLVAAGSTNNGTNLDIALVRYDTMGTPDSGFGTSGIVTTPVGTGDDEAAGIVIQPNGGIVVAGHTTSGAATSFVVARYLSLSGTTTSTSTITTTSTTNATTTSTSTTQPATTSTSTSQPTATTTTSTTQPGATTSTSTITTSSTLGTSTTHPAGPSTTTTLPDPCTLIVRGATFASLECRLGAVDAAVVALGSTKPAPTVAGRLGQAIDLEQRARVTCQGGDARRTGKLLKSTVRKLGKARALLSSKKGRKLPGSAALAGEIDGIRSDMRSLKGSVECPRDASLTFTS
jgi:uncharacterized delta-60 repeat protein